MTNDTSKTMAREITDGIMEEAQMEQDARTAKALMDEFAAWNAKAQAFIQSTGNQPQEPSTFLKNVILNYGLKKLESKIITLK